MEVKLKCGSVRRRVVSGKSTLKKIMKMHLTALAHSFFLSLMNYNLLWVPEVFFSELSGKVTMIMVPLINLPQKREKILWDPG